MVAQQLYIGKICPGPELLQPVKNRPGWVKPETGGLWTSAWDEQARTSGWVDWCLAENFGNVHELPGWLLTPQESARIYEIDGVQNLQNLLVGFGQDAKWGMFDRSIDFEKLATAYDALRLTDAGQIRTRFSRPGLYGWDCESTLWFRWCFTNVEQVEFIRELQEVSE